MSPAPHRQSLPISRRSGNRRPATGSQSGSAEGFDLEDFAVAARTLRDHTGEQIGFAFADPAARLIAAEFADGLDEAGYLRAEPGEIAERLGALESDVLAVLAVCQTFDPAGLFARDLAECLALQLKARDRFDPAMASLVANLELLARRDFVALRRICAVDEEDLLAMVAEIRALDPRPGTAFSGVPPTRSLPMSSSGRPMTEAGTSS